MKTAYALFCAAVAQLLILSGAAALAQESPKHFRLVNENEKYYHPSVEQELFTNRDARNKRKILVGKICNLSSEAPLSTYQKEFDGWFRGYYYPLMTDPKELPNLSKLRRELMRDYFNRIKNEPAGLALRDHLNKLTLTFLQKVAAVNAHPAVRYNAMLIIGDLDSRAAELAGGAKPAEPMFEALEVLQTELNSPTQIDAVRVAALLGLRRHAELNRARPADKQWTEAQVTGLAAKVGPIAALKKPPAGRSVEGHIWMRRLALETLAELGAARPMPTVATLIDRILSDEAEPLEMRVAAAKAQGILKSPLPMGTKPAEAASKIARVGVDVMIADLEELKHYVDRLEREELAGGPRAGAEGGGFAGGAGLGILEGGGSTTEKPADAPIIRDPVVAAAQRRMKARLEAVRQGLVGDDGAAGLAAIGDKAAIDKYAAAIADIQQTLDKDAPTGDPVLLDELQKFYDDLAAKGQALDELLPAAAKPKTEPATPDGPATDSPPADGPAADGPAVDGPVTDDADPSGPVP